MKRTSWAPAVNVSVVVPAYNEAGNIERMLTSVLAQKTRAARILEVFVVASGCTDGTPDLAHRISLGKPGVHVHVQEQRGGKVAALNSYLRMRDPRATVVVVAAADVVLEPDVVEKLVNKLLSNPKIGMVGARPMPDNDRQTLVGRMVHTLWSLHHEVARSTPKLGEVIAFRADLVESVSELSIVDEASIENLICGQGYELAYVEDAIVTNHGPETLPEYFEQRRRIARGHFWLEFAFGYKVSTFDRRVLVDTVKEHAKREDALGKAALVAAVATEVAARTAGFIDARLVGGKMRTWKPLRSTKTLAASVTRKAS